MPNCKDNMMKIEAFEVPQLPISMEDIPDGVQCVCYCDAYTLLVREKKEDRIYACRPHSEPKDSCPVKPRKYIVTHRLDGQPLPEKRWTFDDLHVGEHFKIKEVPSVVYRKLSETACDLRRCGVVHSHGFVVDVCEFFADKTIIRLGFRDVPE